MCIPDDPIIKNTVDDMAHFDENTWEILDQQLVKEAEKAEIARFKKMGVHSYVSRSEALKDPDGSFVKVKWVRTNKGTAAQPNVTCRLVAQEIGYGQWIDELFSGTPSLMSTKMAIVHAAKGGRGIMVMDVKCAFLYLVCRLPYLHRASPPRSQARCGRSCRLAPRRPCTALGTRRMIWAKEVQKVMEGLGFVISMFQPSVYYHPSGSHRCCTRGRLLCSGEMKELEWLYDNLAQKFELKKSLIMKDSEQEVKYLGRTIRCTYDDNGKDHFEVEGDGRRSQLLLQEWAVQHCKDVDTLVTKAGEESINTGDELNENEARRARRRHRQDELHVSGSARSVSCRPIDVPVHVQASRGDSSSDQAGHQILETLSSMSTCGPEQSLRELRD